MTFGEKLYEVILKNDITFKEFAKNINISTGLLLKWLRDEEQPELEEINKILLFYSLDKDYFSHLKFINHKPDSFLILKMFLQIFITLFLVAILTLIIGNLLNIGMTVFLWIYFIGIILLISLFVFFIIYILRRINAFY